MVQKHCRQIVMETNVTHEEVEVSIRDRPRLIPGSDTGSNYNPVPL